MTPPAGSIVKNGSRGWSVAGPVLVMGILAGSALRVVLLPTQGLQGDLDQFAFWIGEIARNGLGPTYDMNLSFPPVMVYIFGLLGAVVPGATSAIDSSDPLLRAAIKIPASLADLGLALGVAWLLRDRPRWAVVAALGVLLLPAVWYTSAWWGQFESIYVLLGLLAAILAIADRPRWSALLLAIAVMTKPQALPFLVPFGAWYLGRYGLRRALELAAIGLATAVVLWLPFIPYAGPQNYLANLAEYQNGIFAVLSLRAWNFWWLIQQPISGADFLNDQGAIFGPVTPRMIGLAITGLLMLIVGAAVYRRPTSRALLLGLACAVLVSFSFLTTMHERYVYGALVFLAPLIPDRRVLVLWLVLAVTASLNIVAAVPATDWIATNLPIDGPIGMLCSLGTVGVTLATLWLLVRESAEPDGSAAAARPAAPHEPGADAPASPA